MNLDDLKDRFSSEFRSTWDRIQESGAYNQMRDRYENMTPGMQKLTIYGGIALVTLMVLSIPYGYFSGSSEAVGEFEGKRMTIRELLKVSREASEVPAIPQAPPMDAIRSTVENMIQSAHLLPEQVKGTQSTGGSNLIPTNLSEGGLQITLAKLNLRQIVDLGYKFANISPSVKMADMTMTANREDNRYFDVVYKLVALAVPAPPVIAAEPEPPVKRGNRGRARSGSDE
ncbi:hypothetical protein [Bdellovibrio sp. GT3]|uniref:hypothetical protein n=1 Tax=unclassified Bdellovibrio TaxID=2633795 RepID=UPI0030F1EB4E